MTIKAEKTRYKQAHFKLFEKGYFFLMVLYTGMSCLPMMALMYPVGSLIYTMIPVLLTIVIVLRNGVFISKNFILLISIVLGWTFLQFLKYRTIYPMTLFLVYNISVSYVIARVYGLQVLPLFERCVSILAFISIIVWVFYSIFPHGVSILMNNMNILSYQSTVKYDPLLQSSIIIASISESKSFLGMRNAGFSQEPGMYASLLVLALFFNLTIKRFKILGNKSLWILLIALATTQSTTGYMGFAALFFFFLYNQKHEYFLSVLLLFVLGIFFLMKLPIMTDKLSEYWFHLGIDELREIVNYLKDNTNASAYVPQRLDGLLFDFQNFCHDPIIGYGMEWNNSFIAQTVSPFVLLSNGFASLFSVFGVVLASLFLFQVIRSGVLLSDRWRFKGGVFFLIIYTVISFSYNFNQYPLLLSVWLCSYWAQRNKNANDFQSAQ